MADDTSQLPAQAQTGLPGAAANAADITTAPPAADVLGPAAYGDKGWQQYQDLQRAGQQAPVPPMPTPMPAALPGDPNASGLGYLLGTGGAAAPSPLMDLFGGQGAAMRFQNAAIQQQEQATALQQKRQALAANGFAFLDSLRKQNVPLTLRAPMIQQWAAQQGLPIDPIQASYIAQWGNDPQKYEEHLLEQIRGGGSAAADAAQKWSELFSGDYNRMIGASDAARKDKAEADLAVNKAANEARIAAGGMPIKTEYQGQRAAATESLTKELGRAPTESEISARLAQTKAQEATSAAVAKEQATTTAATRTMKEAAPKIRALADEVENYLKKIETGPAVGRYQDFMTGKIGAPNPDYMAFKDNASLLSTLLMRMHVGARGAQGMADRFDKLVGAGYQSPENMRSALNVIRKYADIVDGTKEGGEVNVPDKGITEQPVKINSTDPNATANLPKGTRVVDENGRTGTVQ